MEYLYAVFFLCIHTSFVFFKKPRLNGVCYRISKTTDARSSKRKRSITCEPFVPTFEENRIFMLGEFFLFSQFWPIEIIVFDKFFL